MVNLIRKFKSRPFVCGVPVPSNRKACTRRCKACDHCGSITILGGDALQQSNKHQRFFCDIECAGEYKKHHNRTKEYQEISGIVQRREDVEAKADRLKALHKGWKCCLECGKAFCGQGKWCGHECSYGRVLRNRKSFKQLVCSGCGQSYSLFTASKDRKFCGTYCSKIAARTAAKARRRARERRADNPGITWLYVANRDNWQCQGCKCKCIKPEGLNLPNEATLDHILPLSKGGQHTKQNAQLLCRKCNSNKSDRITHGQMLLIG